MKPVDEIHSPERRERYTLDPRADHGHDNSHALLATRQRNPHLPHLPHHLRTRVLAKRPSLDRKPPGRLASICTVGDTVHRQS